MTDSSTFIAALTSQNLPNINCHIRVSDEPSGIEKNVKTGTVHLVGAGSGDPELLTLKALRVMQKADVVLYDSLVSEDILDMCALTAEKIFVGKRRANHALPQEGINELLVKHALAGKTVVRLKGGDPFIFGRGGEELQEVVRHGIHFESIPGITAASAAASRAGIPLTHRDHAQAVKFVTACKKLGAPNNDYDELLDSTQTVVFYMGLNRLDEMTQGLIAAGRDSNTPFAVISHASLPTQQLLIGTLGNIAEQQAEAKLPTPALLIMGDVVNLYHEFANYNLGALGKSTFIDVQNVVSSHDLVSNLEVVTQDRSILVPSDNLSSPVNATIGTGTATGDILDESDNSEDPLDGSNTEGDKPVVSISATDNQAIEGVDSVLKYVVSQDTVSNFDTTISVKVDLTHTDVDASDIESISYTNAAGKVVTVTGSGTIQAILDGDTTLEVKVPGGRTAAPEITVIIKDDVIYEAQESLSFVIDSADHAVVNTKEATGTILDTPKDGDKPTVTVSGASAVEGDILVHKVTLSHTTQTEVSYPFELKDGSAKAGEDYSNTPVFSNDVTYDSEKGTITVPAGVTEFTVSYPTTADNIDESDETTGLTIDGVTGTGTILDNNATPVLNIKAEPNTAIEGSDDPIVFNIEQSGLSDKATSVTVKLDLQDVDASDIDSIVLTNTDGSTQSISVADAINGVSVTIPTGATSNPTFTITPKQDAIYEVSEDFSMSISNPVNATVGTDSATGTILDEDNGDPNDGSTTDGDKPTVVVGNATATEGDNLVHSVTIEGITQADVTYEFNLADGSTNPATAGSDYTNAPVFSNGVINNGDGTITVPAGVTDFTVSYPTLNDSILENDETTTITIGNDSGIGTILDNDTAPTLTVTDNSVIEATGATVSGIFSITDPQSVTALTVGGIDVTAASDTPGSEVRITIPNSNLGTLVITSYNSQTGKLTYEYKENGNAEDHSAGSVIDQFNVVLTNTIGGIITDTLDIEIIDTAPTANDDKNNVIEDVNVNQSGQLIATGNVITGTAPDQADDLGADATTVTAVEFGSAASTVDSTAPTLIQGNFGQLTLEADGSYTYNVDNSAVEFLAVGVTREETFNYTITDADGSTDTAKLTITITGTNDQPTITADSNDNIANISFVEQTDDSVITQSGIIAFSDIDVSDTLTLNYLKNQNQYGFGANTSLTALTTPQKTALEEMFSITQATNNNGTWKIEAEDTDINFLPAGETITIRYAVQVNDNKGVDTAANGNEISTSEIRYVEVTITGTNDGGIALADNTITINENGTTTKSGKLATIFDANDTDDPDVGEQLTVESFQIDGGAIQPLGTAIDVTVVDANNVTQTIGNITFNSDGTYEYVATSDYSGTLPVITVNVSNGVTGATHETDSQTLTITVKPVSDKPILAPNKTVFIDEDNTKALGLKAPIIKDAIDLDGTGNNTDNPERIGLITLSGVRAGTTLNYKLNGVDKTITSTGANITIKLDDVPTINSAGTATATMSKADFEAMRLTPPKDDATNFNINMSVTEYEVNESGDIARVDANGSLVNTGGTAVAGETSTTTIKVDVQAVTDSSTQNSQSGHDAGDDFSEFGYVTGTTLVNGKYEADTTEGGFVDLPIDTTFGDLVGSAANGSRETYGFVITGLVPGAIINFTPAGSSESLPPFIADENGQVLIGINAGLTSTDFVVSGNSEPKITIQTGKFDSLDMNGVEISLYTQDHDPDSAIKNTSVELIGTVKVNLTVTPVAG